MIAQITEKGIALRTRLANWQQGGVSALINECGKEGIRHVILDTKDASSKDRQVFAEDAENAAGEILGSGVVFHTENGYARNNERCLHHGLSTAEEVLAFTRMLRKKTGDESGGHFRVCLDAGVGKLMGMDVPSAVRFLSSDLEIFRAADGSTLGDMAALPGLLSEGRYIADPSWYAQVRALREISFDEILLLGCEGFLSHFTGEKSPESRKKAALSLAEAVLSAWEKQIRYGEYLKEASRGKTVVLFGSGRVFDHYMDHWGGACPPDLVCDNNPARQGQILRGVPVKAPAALEGVDPDALFVLITAARYDDISLQLEAMGIRADLYEDLYDIWEDA